MGDPGRSRSRCRGRSRREHRARRQARQEEAAEARDSNPMHPGHLVLQPINHPSGTLSAVRFMQCAARPFWHSPSSRSLPRSCRSAGNTCGCRRLARTAFASHGSELLRERGGQGQLLPAIEWRPARRQPPTSETKSCGLHPTPSDLRSRPVPAALAAPVAVALVEPIAEPDRPQVSRAGWLEARALQPRASPRSTPISPAPPPFTV